MQSLDLSRLSRDNTASSPNGLTSHALRSECSLHLPCSYSKSSSLTPHPIEHTRIIHRNILLGDSLDDLLANHTTRQCPDVVQFTAARPHQLLR